MGASVWDREGIVDELKRLRNEGLSANRIADALAFKFNVMVTRNSVLGKLDRMGLGLLTGHAAQRAGQKRAKVTLTAYRAPSRLRPIKPLRRALEMAPEPMPETKPEIVVDEKNRVGVVGLTQFQCRWPIGDPQLPDFHFCDRKQVVGTSYCETHLRRAFQPPKLRSRPDPARPYVPAERVKEEA